MYYAHDDESVFASSHLAALLAMLQRAPPVSELGLTWWIAFGAAPKHATLYEGVHRVGSYERIVVTPNATTQRRALPIPEAELMRLFVENSPEPRRGRAGARQARDEAGHEALAERLWSTIDQAVSAATRGHDRVAILGGGGLDSSTLLATALAHARGGSIAEVVNVFMAFAGPDSDVPYHRDVAKSLGITPVIVKPTDPTELPADTCLDAQPYPFPTLPFDLMWHRRAREAGATVVLTGAGGDELFGGDLRYFAHRAKHEPFAAVREALALTVPWETTRASRLREWIAQPLAKASLPESVVASHVRRQWLARMPWLGPGPRACIEEAARLQARTHVAETTPYGRFAHEASGSSWCDFADARTQLESACDITREDPFLQDVLLRFLSATPLAAFFSGGLHRGLLRRALRGRVPDSVRLRRGKAVFEPALNEALRVPAFSAMLAKFTSTPVLESMGLVDGPRFRIACRTIHDPQSAGWCDLWQTMSAEGFAARR